MDREHGSKSPILEDRLGTWFACLVGEGIRVTVTRSRRGWIALSFLILFVIVFHGMAPPYVHGLSFVMRAADMHGVLRRAADFDAESIRERERRIPMAVGTVRARVYEPARNIRRTALLVGGLHAGGCDEPRLVAFARQLAASGVAVVTPAIPELSQFSITPALTDAIEAVAVWLAADKRLAPDGRIGMMGVSFLRSGRDAARCRQTLSASVLPRSRRQGSSRV